MINIEDMKVYLKNNLREDRYNHTLGVAETAKKLAKINEVDIEKAEIAGLAHDIAKNMDKLEMKRIIEENSIILSDVEKNNKNLWHSIIAPIVAKDKLGIVDEEILSALRYHTTGKEDMTTLEKIIFIADMIEPGRDFITVDEIRKQTFANLDKGVLMGLTRTMIYLLDRDLLIEPNTMKARNYILLNSKNI